MIASLWVVWIEGLNVSLRELGVRRWDNLGQGSEMGILFGRLS